MFFSITLFFLLSLPQSNAISTFEPRLNETNNDSNPLFYYLSNNNINDNLSNQFSDLSLLIKKNPDPSKNLIILISPSPNNYIPPKNLMFSQFDFKSIQFLNRDLKSKSQIPIVKFFINESQIQVQFEGITFQSKSDNFQTLVSPEHNMVFDSNIFYLDNSALVLKNCRFIGLCLKTSSTFYYLRASKLLVLDSEFLANNLQFSSMFFNIESNYNSSNITVLFNNVTFQNNLLETTSYFIYFQCFLLKNLKLSFIKVKILENIILSDSSFIYIDIYLNRVLIIFNDVLISFNSLDKAAQGILILQDNSLTEAHLGNHGLFYQLSVCFMYLINLIVINNVNENKLIGLNGGQNLTNLRIISSYFESNNLNSGHLIEISKINRVEILKNFFRNTVKTGVTLSLSLINTLILFNNSIINLFNNYEISIREVSHKLLISGLFSYNEPNFKAHISTSTKDPWNLINRIGGVLTISQCFNITLSKIVLKNLILMNTPAISLLECDHTSICPSIFKLIIIMNLISINNTLINSPDSTACLSLTHYTNNSIYILEKVSFINNSLTSEPTYGFSSSGLIFQGIMSNVFLSNPMIKGNIANHQAAGFRVFARIFMIKGGLIMKNSIKGVTFRDSLQGIAYISCKEFAIKGTKFKENISGQLGVLYIMNSDSAMIIIDGCDFKGNLANSGAAISFGLNDVILKLLINNCNFVQNTANNYAGAIAFNKDCQFSTIFILNCTFIMNNVWQGPGGAIYMAPFPIELTLNLGTDPYETASVFFVWRNIFEKNAGDLGKTIHFMGGNMMAAKLQILLKENIFIDEEEEFEWVGDNVPMKSVIYYQSPDEPFFDFINKDVIQFYFAKNYFKVMAGYNVSDENKICENQKYMFFRIFCSFLFFLSKLNNIFIFFS